MIHIINLSFAYSDEFFLFHQLNLNISPARQGLVGPNASGKSTLLSLLAGQLSPTAGSIFYETKKFLYLPQLDGATEAESLDLRLLRTGRAIQAEAADLEDWTFMAEHWGLYAAMEKQLELWGLTDLVFSQTPTLSGGSWQRLRLALALAHEGSFLLLDEPSNHLDREARLLLIKALNRHQGGCLIASHDRELLNTMDLTLALESTNIQVYGGPYDFYKTAYDQQQAAFQAAWDQTRQELDRTRAVGQRVREKQARKSALAHKNRDKLGISRAGLGLMRMQAEQTSAQLQARHEAKVVALEHQLRKQAQKLIHKPELNLDVKTCKRPGNRHLLSLEGVQHRWTDQDLWAEPIHAQLGASEHMAIFGANGSGKSTLLQLIIGQLQPHAGRIHRRFREAFLLDQNLGSLPQNQCLLDVWNSPLYITDEGLRRTIAARLGLKAREAATLLAHLSGGQRLRAALVLLATRLVPPDLILLDEPSNHLDLMALECLVSTLRALPASLIVVTHDSSFLEDLSVHLSLELVRAR